MRSDHHNQSAPATPRISRLKPNSREIFGHHRAAPHFVAQGGAVLVSVTETHDNAEKSAVESATRQVYRLLSDGIEALGGIAVAAGVCGTDRGDLRRSLDRDGRRVAVEHAIAIGARLRLYNATLTTKLGSALVETFDLEVFPRVTLTDKERADRLERLVLSMPLGQQLLSDAYGGRK